MKKKLVFIQPYSLQYRISIVEELQKSYDVIFIYSESNENSGFGNIDFKETKIFSCIPVPTETYFGGRIIYQQNLIKIVKELKPDLIFASAALRDVGYWSLMIYSFLSNIPFFSHGQGPFNKPLNIVTQIQYRLLLLFTKKYIAYNTFSKLSFERHYLLSKKVEVANNSIVNSFPISYQNKSFNNRGILFIGRLRDGANLDLLIKVLIKLNEAGEKLVLHVIGTGVNDTIYREKYGSIDFIQWHGEIFNQHQIAQVSKNAVVGCYPGNTGLSVVHFFSLSLPVIIHNNHMKHQGPESSYVVNSYNGRLFDFFDAENTLCSVIKDLINNKQELEYLSKNAYETYLNLSSPSYAQQLELIFN